jgi:hypothetical protein
MMFACIIVYLLSVLVVYSVSQLSLNLVIQGPQNPVNVPDASRVQSIAVHAVSQIVGKFHLHVLVEADQAIRHLAIESLADEALTQFQHSLSKWGDTILWAQVLIEHRELLTMNLMVLLPALEALLEI